MFSPLTISLLLTAILLCQAQVGGPYRKAAPSLKPVGSKAPSYSPPRVPTPPGAVPPGESSSSRDRGPVLFPDTERDRIILDAEGQELLLKFDDYLFTNLEQAYHRLSYAFKDAVRRTMNKCQCDVGSLERPTTDNEKKSPPA